MTIETYDNCIFVVTECGEYFYAAFASNDNFKNWMLML